MTKIKNGKVSTKKMVGTALLTALSYVVYLLEIPIFAATPASFLKLDFSNVFILFAGFMYGPVYGVFALVIKEVIHIFLGGTTGGVGELANIIVGLAYVLLPTILYYYKKGIKSVVITLLCACVLQTGISLIVNKFINFPFFTGSVPFITTEVSNSMFAQLWVYILSFNAIKSVASTIITILLYKKTSYLFKKIILQEDSNDLKKKVFISKSEEDTFNFACEFAKTLSKGDVLLLNGEMGAGKTAFVKGLAKGLKITEEVTSPTYSYLNVYGNLLYHYDLYRVESSAQAEGLGLTDYFKGDNICVLEWSENIKEELPDGCKKVIIEKIGKNKRKITV